MSAESPPEYSVDFPRWRMTDEVARATSPGVPHRALPSPPATITSDLTAPAPFLYDNEETLPFQLTDADTKHRRHQHREHETDSQFSQRSARECLGHYEPEFWRTGDSEGCTPHLTRMGRELHTVPLAPNLKAYRRAESLIHWTIVRASLFGMLDKLLVGSLSFALAGLHHTAIGNVTAFPQFKEAFTLVALSPLNFDQRTQQPIRLTHAELTTFSSATGHSHPIARHFVHSSLKELHKVYVNLINGLRAHAESMFTEHEFYQDVIGTRARLKTYNFKCQLTLVKGEARFLHDPNIQPGSWLSPILMDMTAAMLNTFLAYNVLVPWLRHHNWVLPFTVLTIPSLMLESELIFISEGKRAVPAEAFLGWAAVEDSGIPNRVAERNSLFLKLDADKESRAHRELKLALKKLVFDMVGPC